MFIAKCYLDTRATAPGSPAPLKARMTFKGQTLLVGLGVKVTPDQWQPDPGRVVSHPQARQLNSYLTMRLSQINADLMRLEAERKLNALSASDLRKVLEGKPLPEDEAKRGNFLRKYLAFAATRNSQGTRTAYNTTLVRLRAFDPGLETRSFEDIDKDYLNRFDAFLAKTNCRNSRNVHYRNIRAVFNDAIDDELTTAYPFRKFKLRSEPTRKRSLSVEQLRTLRDYPVEEWQKKYRDIFMLMFYLIGINAVDLFNAPKDALRNGRLEYIRAKTHKAYSVKVEPEAQEIIDRYAGTEHLLDIMDTHTSYKDWLHRMGEALKTIGPCVRTGRGGRKTHSPLFPGISQYWCRHTWATLAAELDIPKETISAGLGHDIGCATTSIYIRYDYKKVDAANRQVIDYVKSERVI